MKNLIVMAGGTGGHIFPGLAIARIMAERGWTVTWIGTSHGMENELVPKYGIPIDTINFSGLRGKGLWHTVCGIVKICAALFDSYIYIGRRKPDLVLGMGGYVTVPGGIMAKLRGIPLVLVNADAALLLSNKALSRLASSICFGFSSGTDIFLKKAVVTGNPVRAEILKITHPAERFKDRHGGLRVLIIGGSLGARVLNEVLPAALALIPVDTRPSVTHQCGKGNFDAVQSEYKRLKVTADVVDFIDNMADLYAKVDLVICRAGAITVTELITAGVASVLVPLVISTTSHQRANAEWLAARNATIHLPQSELNSETIATLFRTLTREECQRMAINAYEYGRRDANDRIAHVIEQFSNS